MIGDLDYPIPEENVYCEYSIPFICTYEIQFPTLRDIILQNWFNYLICRPNILFCN